MESFLDPSAHIDHDFPRGFEGQLTAGFCIKNGQRELPQTLVTLYKTLVRPVVEYGTVKWAP